MVNAVGRSLLVASLFSLMGLQAVAEERSPLAPLQKGGTNPEVPLVKGDLGGSQGKVRNQIPRVRDLKRPATTLKDWMAQVESATVQVTGVKLERTDAELEITLETAAGKPLQVDATKFRAVGNSLIADIPNAVLALPEGQAFAAENPTADIASVRVVQQDASSIRVSVTGNNALPKTEVTLKTGGLAYSLNSEGETPEEELVVTGEQNGYRLPNTSVGTRTDTPLRDIPQSIQIVPQQVLEDQNISTFNEALRNAPGVAPARVSTTENAIFFIRGFRNFDSTDSSVLRNGLRQAGPLDSELTPNIERIEVLSGPASVLYGSGNPGGTINIVTKQPLRDPFYALDATIGSYNFYEGEVDLSGPLNDSKTLLYRLNAGYVNRESFFDFFKREQFTVAPVLSWDISERTRFTLEGQYTDSNQVFREGLPAVGTVLPNPNGRIPRDFFPGDPGGINYNREYRVGYRLEHQFSNNWSIQNAFQVIQNRSTSTDRIRFNFELDADNRTLNGILFDNDVNDTNGYDLNLNLTGRFSTGSIAHQLIFGTDLNRFEQAFDILSAPAPPLDLFDPVYRLPAAGPYTRVFVQNSSRDTLGIYVQDQVTLAKNLKLLLGGRFDAFKSTTENLLADTESSQSGSAFSPRVGIVYQPIQPVSLYASYSRSFSPVIGTSFEGNLFEPERGTQYEVGVKTDLNDRLAVTLALYELTRSGVLTEDRRPGVPPNLFSIQTGKQRSRGVELSVAGEILPGWNILAGYTYNDAIVSEDNTIPVGNRLDNVPENAINFWTTYEIQRGPWKGFGMGLGFFFVGERQGTIDNTFQLPSYFRTDAAIFYKRDRFRVGLNFRNLFDVEYFETSDGAVGPYYGEPFTVQGTIRLEF